MRSNPLLLLLLTRGRVAASERPLPPSGGDAGRQCTSPGGCDDGIDENADGEPPYEGYVIEGEDPRFLEYLDSLDAWEVPEMHGALSDIVGNAGMTTAMQRHVERTLIARRHPDGDGAEDPEGPTYVSFGSLLDVSTAYSVSWGGSTEFGGKPAWLASLFYREDVSKFEGRMPCRLDLADDYDAEDDDYECCHLAVTIDDYVAVRPTREKKEEHMVIAATWDVLDEGIWRTGTVTALDFGERKFDTIVANGVLTGEDEGIITIMEKLISLLKPGGVAFFVGTEPPVEVDDSEAYNEILDAIESAKKLAGEQPTRNVPAAWINENLDRLGLDVFSSTRFPIRPTLQDIIATINDGKEWISRTKSEAMTAAFKLKYRIELNSLSKKIKEVARDGPIFAGEHQYIIAAELPKVVGGEDPSAKQVEPTVYRPKPKRVER